VPIPGNFLSETTSTIDPNTSGWTTKLNCTLSRGTGGSVTTGCLLMKSVASGEMQCRTVASYPVTPWQEYAAFADASGATVPERIGIRWLDAASAEISISWSMTTATASATWHRIAVADWAPAGAVYAQVVFSSTPAAGNVNQFFDHVYLGLPQRTTGNLLASNTETSERSGSWEYLAVTNCTLSRTVPMVAWSSSLYTVGGHVATMTVTASAAASFRSTDWPEVTPGQEYLAYAYLNPPASGTAAWIELRFYDASFAQIAATKANLSAPGTGWYQQRVSAVAPANAAYATVAMGLDTATAGQILRTDGAVITVAPVLREGSVVPYADASFEKDVAGWTVVSGVATLARLTPWGTDWLDGSYCMAVSSATATTSVIRSAKFAAGAAGSLDWTVEAAMKVAAGGWTLTRAIRWYDAANADLGATAGTPAAVPTPTWWILNTSFTAPPTATQAAIEYTLTATSTSSVLRMDKAALWQSLPMEDATAVDETASVTVTLRELPTTSTITVWRVTPDGTRTLVRGADGLIDAATITSDVLVIEDYEAPLGVEVYYYSESRDTSNVITATHTTDPVTLDPGDPNYCWLKDPGNPQRNARIQAVTAPDWQRPISQTPYRVRGRRNAVTLSDVRGGLEGELTLRTRDDDGRAALHWVLDSGNALFLQFAPGLGFDDMYVNVGQVPEARITPYGGELRRLWTLPLVQADMPVAVGVAGSAGRTWQDVLTEHATWEIVLDGFVTWEDVLFNRPIGG
jgi:hypothetical protein